MARRGQAGPWARPVLALATLMAVVVAACTSATEDQGLTIFAAASLRSVVDELESAWSSEYPQAPLTISTDGSNILAAQIAEGAPADVFLSADTERPQGLAERGLTAGAPVAFATNRITLVVPAGSEGLTTPLGVAEPGVRLVGINEGAPIARYTHEAVSALARTTADPDRFVEAVGRNTASREDNVRAALAKVALGEGDAAFVYVTDARDTDEVRELPLPATARIAADYAAVQISDRQLASEFIDWLRGPDASAIVAAAGFESPA